MNAIKTPQNSRSVRTRAAVLDAAWSLLEEQGPEAATMAAVAAAAGVSRRGLYLHFSSRSDLFVALIRHRDKQLDLEGSLRLVREAPDASGALDEWVGHLVRYHARIRPVVEAVDWAAATDADAAAMKDSAMTGWRGGIRTLVVERLAAEGRLASEWTVPSATDALLSLALGFNPMWRALVADREWTSVQVHDFLLRLHRRTFIVEPEAR